MKHGKQENQLSPSEDHSDKEKVARRAYELYQERGGEPGHELKDWLNAELELSKESQAVRSEA